MVHNDYESTTRDNVFFFLYIYTYIHVAILAQVLSVKFLACGLTHSFADLCIYLVMIVLSLVLL